MQSKKWLKFLQDIIPEEKIRKDLQKFFGARLLSTSFVFSNIHGTFDQPCKNAGGFSTKIVK